MSGYTPEPKLTKKQHKQFEAIAARFGVETLDDRNSDDLDFYDLGVGSLRRMLAAAYELGKQDAKA